MSVTHLKTRQDLLVALYLTNKISIKLYRVINRRQDLICLTKDVYVTQVIETKNPFKNN